MFTLTGDSGVNILEDENPPSIEDFFREPVGAFFRFIIIAGNLTPDENEIQRKTKLIKETDPEFLKNLLTKFFNDVLTDEDMAQPGTLTRFLLSIIPETSTTTAKLLSEKSTIKTYIPSCSRNCSIHRGEEDLFGFEIRTPVSFFRIEGCRSQKDCKERVVQFALKGINHLTFEIKHLKEQVLINTPYHDELISTGYKVLNGEVDLKDCLDYFKASSLYGIENMITPDKLQNMKIPDLYELIYEVFEEERISGFILYPVNFGIKCTMSGDFWTCSHLGFKLNFLLRHDPEALKQNVLIATIGALDKRFEEYVCMGGNCGCTLTRPDERLTVSEGALKKAEEKEERKRIIIDHLTAVFSLKNIKNLMRVYGLSEKEAIRMIFKVHRLVHQII